MTRVISQKRLGLFKPFSFRHFLFRGHKNTHKKILSISRAAALLYLFRLFFFPSNLILLTNDRFACVHFSVTDHSAFHSTGLRVYSSTSPPPPPCTDEVTPLDIDWSDRYRLFGRCAPLCMHSLVTRFACYKGRDMQRAPLIECPDAGFSTGLEILFLLVGGDLL